MVLDEINELAQSNSFTSFEQTAFKAICRVANLKARFYLEKIYFENKTIKKVVNVNVLLDAYIFMCAAELHLFVHRWEGGNKLITDLQDVPIVRFTTDFVTCFGELEEMSDYFHHKFTLFEESLLSNIYDLCTFACPPDNREFASLYNLWYFQSLHFGNIISEGKIDFLSKALNDTTELEKIEFITSVLPGNIDFVAGFDKMLLEQEENEEIKTIITCNKCGQALKIPMGKNLRVTCRKCKCVFDYSIKTGPFECGCCAALLGSFAMGKAGNKRWKEKGPKAIFQKIGADPSSKEVSTLMSELVVCEWEDTTEEVCGHATIGFCQKCGIPLCREHVYSS
jgi:hypothetical protein